MQQIPVLQSHTIIIIIIPVISTAQEKGIYKVSGVFADSAWCAGGVFAVTFNLFGSGLAKEMYPW